jgi:hypothetical protein
MFEPLRDRIQVVEVSTNRPGVERVDIALIDSFAQTRDVNDILGEANATRYVFDRWSLEPELIETWARFGVVGFLDKRLTAEQLADALERIHQGESGVISASYPPSGGRPRRLAGARFRTQRPRGGGHCADHQGLSNEELAGRIS